MQSVYAEQGDILVFSMVIVFTIVVCSRSSGSAENSQRKKDAGEKHDEREMGNGGGRRAGDDVVLFTELIEERFIPILTFPAQFEIPLELGQASMSVALCQDDCRTFPV